MKDARSDLDMARIARRIQELEGEMLIMQARHQWWTTVVASMQHTMSLSTQELLKKLENDGKKWTWTTSDA